jgi:superfamily II DNA or RNA helicase
MVEDVKRELTVTPIIPGGGSGPVVPSFSLWLESRSRLYVPKHYGLERFGVPETCVIPDGVDITVRFSGGLRPEQLAPANAFLKAARDPRHMGGVLSLPCGAGKTVIALHILSVIGKKTVIVVHKNFLLEQWRERIETFLPGARIGVVKADVCDVRDKDVVIASVQSLSTKSYDLDLFADVGLLIVDEVHRTGTNVFSRAFYKTNVKMSLGLSATVKRKDGMTKVFTWFIGDVVFSVEGRRDVVNVLAKRYYDASGTPEGETYREEPQGYGGSLNTARMINNITAHVPRTIAIVAHILEAVCPSASRPSASRPSASRPSAGKRRVLVLSDRKKQLRDIFDRLDASPVSCGFYIGGMKSDALAASQDKDVILATFSFASEGFDVPGLDTLVLASPKTDIEQSVGRILRQRASDRANTPLVIDFVDSFSVFQGQAKKRLAYYRKRGYTLVDRIHPMDTQYEAALGMSEEDAFSEDDHDSDDGPINGPDKQKAFAFVDEDE